MKKYFLPAFLLLATIFLNLEKSNAQCGWSGQSNQGTLPGIPCGSFSSVSNIGSGTYTFFTAYQGSNYTFSTCGDGYDTELTIYWFDGSSWVAQAFDDDNGPDCGGLQASINWTNPNASSGNYLIVLNEWNCLGHTGVSHLLLYRENAPGAPSGNPSGGTTICTGSSVTLSRNSTPPTGITYYWETDPSGTSTSIGSGSTLTVSPGVGSTTYYVRPVSGSGCWGTASAGTTVTVSANSSAGSLSTTGPIVFCDVNGDFSTAVTVSGYTGSPVWQWGSSNGVWNNWVGGTSSGTCCFPKKTSLSDGNADRVRVGVTNSPCATVFSSTVLIQNKYNEAPTSLASNQNNFCSGSLATITLTATFPSATNILGNVEFSNISCGGTPIATVSGNGTTTVSATITPPTTTTTYYVRYNPGSGTGCSATGCAQTTVTVAQTPTTSNAGVDQTNCGSGSFTLAGNNPSVGSGNWSLVSGTASITSSGSFNSGVTGVPAGTSATLRWSISNGTCTPSTDDVILTNNAPAVVTTGGPDVTCGSATPSAISLTGASVTGGTTFGAWSILSGGGSLSSVVATSSPALVTYTPAANFSGTVTLQLLSNDPDGAGPCPAVSNTRTITVNAFATATAGGPDVACQSGSPSPITLTGASVGGAGTTGAWSIVSGGGTLSSTASLPSASLSSVTYTPAANFAGTVTLLLTSNDPDGAGPCAAATSSRTITVNTAATATGGGPDVVCGSPTPSAITLTGSSVGGGATTGAWSILSGGGSLSSTAQIGSVLLSSVTYTPATGFSGTVTLQLTSNDPDGAGPCAAATTTRTITINPYATATAGGPDQACQSSSPSAITLTGASVGGAGTTGAWSIVSGGGTLSSTSQTPNVFIPTITYTPAANFSGTVTLLLTSNDPDGAGPCVAATSTRTITVSAAATATAGGPDVMCGSSTPSSITLSGASVGGGATSGTWSISSGGGSLSNTSQIPSASLSSVTYTPVANFNGTVTLLLTSNDPDGAGPCVAATSTRTITVNAGATATAGGPDQVCQSPTPSAITLAGSSVGGAATTGAWSIISGGGTLSNTSQIPSASLASVTYTPAANFSGTVTLLLTSNDPDGAGPCAAITATRTITVNPLPTDISPVAQASSVCSGSGTNIQILNSQSGVSYQLRDNGTNSNVGSAINGNGATVNLPTGNLSSTTTYNVLATNNTTNCSLQMSGTVTVTVNTFSTDPSGATASASTICLGTTNTTVSVVGGSLGTAATFHWYSGSCGLTPVGIGSTVTVVPTTTTTYFVRAEGTCNNTNCAQVTITVNDTARPATSIIGTSPICNGLSSNLSANGTLTGVGASWQWYSASCGGTPAGSGSLITVSPTTTTTYFLRAEATCNTTICRQFTVVVNPTPNGSITSSTSICFGTSTSLAFNFAVGTGPFNVQYTDGTNIYSKNNVNTGDTIMVAPTVTTTYTFTQITDANGCVRTTGFLGGSTVTVTPLPVINSVAKTDVLCNGDSTGTITVTASSGTPPLGYSINNGATYQTGNLFTGLPIGTYKVRVNDLQGCVSNYIAAVDSIVINQPTAIVIDSTPTQQASCSSVFDGAISVYPSGGTPAYVYSLNGGPTQPGNSFTGLASGIYTVYAIDAHGCTVSRQDTITNSYAVVGSIVSQTDVSCYGGSNGAVTVRITGGIPPYSFSLSGGGFQSDSTFTGLTSGNYTVIVRDSKGCTDFVSVHINQPTQIALNIDSVSNVRCNGGSTGNIYLSVTGGTPGYIFSWSNSATSQNNLNVPIGTYTVTVTDSKGCSSFTSATITQPQPLTLAVASSHNLRCSGDSTGSIDITVGGGVTPYTFAWSNGASSEDIFGLAAGTYSVTIQDANGCTQNTTVTLTQPAPFTVSVTKTDVLCHGDTTGQVFSSVSGGSSPYNYAWNTGATTTGLSNVSAGNYSVIVTDAHGCSTVGGVNVGQPAQLTLSTQVANIGCNGDTAGAIDLTVTGGTAAYSYLWNTGYTGEDLINQSAGTYSVVVTDNAGCSASTSATITQPSAPLAGSLQATDVTCNGAANGSVNLTLSGGTQPYTYLWSNTATTEDISGLGPNTYTVTASDANGCQFTGSATVAEPAALTASIVRTNVTCFGGNDGAANLTVGGGNTPYTYLWSNFETTQDIDTLIAGNYVAVVTDAKGCQVFAPVTITQPTQVAVTGVVTNLNCNGNGGGAINITATGGVGSFTYLWSNTSTAEDQTGLSAGTYSVVVTDGNGCTASASFTITQPTPISASIASQGNVSCNGGSNGYVNISVSGGVSPYTYLWSNSSTTQNLNNVGAGSYSVVITDANTCTASVSASVTEPSAITASIQVGTISCNSGTTNVDLTVAGGTGTYSYFWNTGATTEDLTGVGAGVYTVLATDGNGCTATASTTINQPSAITLSTVVTNVLCHDSLTGAIDLTVNGGVPTFVYAWSNSASTQDLSNIGIGTYSVLVTDGNGCTATTTATVTQPTAMVLNATTTDVACAGGANGSVDITVNGGVFPYSYLWSNTATTEDIHNVSGGTYSVTVTDANGCTLTRSFTIIEPTPLIATIQAGTISCSGGTTNVDLTVTGGTGAYSYFWTNGATSEDLTGVGAGTYTVLVTDANSCTATASTTINVPAAITLSTVVTNVLCHDSLTGAIDLTVNGGVPTFIYAWSNSASTQDLSNIGIGTYSVLVTDGNGCTATTTATVTQPTAMVLNATTTDVACAGGANGSVDITVNGGVFPYSYLWSNTATTEDIHNVSGGTYSVTVTDANGCSMVRSFTITEPTVLNASIQTGTISCSGGTTNVDLTVTGGTGAYSYFWTNGATSEDLTGVGAGTYTVLVTDANSCTATASTTINQPSAITLSTVVTNVLCHDSLTGAIDLTVNGGVPTFIYAWSNSASTQDLSNIGVGTYSVLVTDGNGCTATTTATVTQPTAMVLNATTTNITCAGGASGSVDITVNGGVFPYSYLWSNTATTEDIHNLNGGTYSVTVTDANGCTLTRTFTITEPTALSASIQAGTISCNGGTTNVDLTVTGGTGTYSYFWTNGATSEDLVGVGAGTYTVLATDANGCTATASTTISQPAAITLSTVVTNVLCHDSLTGAIDLTVNGGVPTFVYAWSNSAGTQDLSNIGIGTYSVLVTDGNSCTATTTATVTQPTAMVLNATTTNVACAGGANGSVDITVNGGVFPYSYLWSNTATTEDIHNVSGGTYSVTVTDANGCTLTRSFTLTEPAPMVSSVAGTNVTCHGSDDGAANLTVNGGAQPYTYLWNTFQAQQDLDSLSGGTYYVIITDANGCNKRDSVVITEPAAIVLSTVVTNVLCAGGTNGAIDLSVSGGSPGYTYLWSNTATSQDLSGLDGGTYSVVVTDSHSCTAGTSVVVTEPSAIILNSTITNVGCAGGANGSVDITVNGGVLPYSYLWSNTATSEDIHNVSGGTYSVTVTDANGCSIIRSFTVTEPSAITSSIVGTDVTCHGAANGTANLTVGGGTSPYTYAWSNFLATQDLTNLNGGTYYVIITDANGCTRRDSVIINEPSAIVLSTVVTNVACNSGLTGIIDLTVSGGVPGYTYLWNTTATTQDLNGVAAGTYSVVVTDTTGCTATASATVTQPTAVIVASSTVDVTCAGANNGSIDITVNGGVFPYTYLWNTTATTQDLYNLAGGTYDLTVTDANGCTVGQSYTILEPLPITSSVTGTPVSCHGAGDGTADLTVGGGTQPYYYSWSNFQASQDLSNLDGGTYYVIITDANGCSKRDSIVIAEPTAIVLTVTSQNILCNGNSGGTVDLTVSGGTPGYTYLWSNTATTQDLNGVGAGTYSVVVTDTLGCTATLTTTVSQPTGLVVTGQVIDAHCAGSNDGIINVTVTGGLAPYQYLWSTTATTEDLYNLSAGNYTVSVTDANSCSTSASFTVSQPSNMVSSVVGTDVLCQGANNGTADLTVTGGVQPYDYLWSNFEATQDLQNLDGGIYFVLITDAAGCTHRDSVIIAEPSPLILSTVVTSITCYNFNNGTIDLSVVGGTPAYNYLWSNGDTTQDLDSLAGGVYTVTVTDNHGCSAVTSGIIANPSQLSSNFVVHNTLCNGDQNGTIDLIPSGGTPSYTYSWSNTATSEDLNGLGAGTYYVTITDVKGCIRLDSATVTEPHVLYTSGIIQNVSCAGLSDGSIVITVYGGTLPYSFHWSNGASTKDLYNLSGGNKTVDVTDLNGCQVSSLYTVTEPLPLVASVSGTNVACFGGATGTATVSATGGTSPYQFLWDDFTGGTTHNGLTAGQYVAMVIDSNNCQAFDSITITEPLQLVLSAALTNITCNGASTGAIDLTVSGGTGAYGYAWTPSGTTQDLTAIPAGPYSVVVTDANSCTETASYIITEPAAIATQFFTNQPSCFGSNNGSVSVDATNGTGSFTYAWSTTPVQTTATADNLGGGPISVTVTDAAGCSASSSVTLNQPDSIGVSTNAYGSKCFNNASGLVIATVSGGDQPYIYQLNGVAQLSDTFAGLQPGNYLLLVTDRNGCTGRSPFGIASPSQISVHLTAAEQVILTGMNTQLVATTISASPVIGYIWSPDSVVDFSACTDPNNCNAPYVHPLTTTTFTVTVMNSDSCTASDTVTVVVNNQYSQFIPNSFTPNGDGLNDRFEFDFLGGTNIEVSVFDRWGGRVYYDAAQTNGITGNHGWDGTKGGKDVPDDTYVYQLRVTYYDGSVKDISGTVTLMR